MKDKIIEIMSQNILFLSLTPFSQVTKKKLKIFSIQITMRSKRLKPEEY